MYEDGSPSSMAGVYPPRVHPCYLPIHYELAGYTAGGHAGKRPSRQGGPRHAQPRLAYGTSRLVMSGTSSRLVSDSSRLGIQTFNQG